MSRLFIHLTKRPTWIYYPEQPVSDEALAIVVDGNEFTHVGFVGFTGFYDWLRSGPDKLIGVRYVPFEQTRFLLRALERSRMIQVDRHASLLIFFDDDRQFLEGLSADQAFEEARVLRSSNGSYGLLLGCSGLSEGERIDFRRFIT